MRIGIFLVEVLMLRSALENRKYFFVKHLRCSEILFIVIYIGHLQLEFVVLAFQHLAETGLFIQFNFWLFPLLSLFENGTRGEEQER